MAADLKSIIRVNRHTLEQKQKALADLYAQAEALDMQKSDILAKLEEERNALDNSQDDVPGVTSVEMLSAFERYKTSVIQRVDDIDDDMAALNERIDIAREEMREVFAEVKKLEITQENREAEEAREIDKKISGDLDEIGLEIFRQKQDSDV